MLRTAFTSAALAGATFLAGASPAAAIERQRVTFPSSGTQIVGYHYSPDQTTRKTPLVVIAHGLGGLQTSRLQPFAERFAAAGYHALTFDYRNWGESAGTPRNLLDAGRQQDDYRAAVAAAAQLPGVDAQRVVLWGTSLSGGHVLTLGAAMPKLAGVIAQAPHVNGFATVSALPLGTLPGLTAAGLDDAARAALGRPPRYVALAGRSGQFAALTQAGAAEGYAFVQPTSPAPGNVMTARFVLQLPFYSPDATAAKSTVPTFIGVADQDNVTPPKPAIALASAWGRRSSATPVGTSTSTLVPRSSRRSSPISCSSCASGCRSSRTPASRCVGLGAAMTSGARAGGVRAGGNARIPLRRRAATRPAAAISRNPMAAVPHALAAPAPATPPVAFERRVASARTPALRGLAELADLAATAALSVPGVASLVAERDAPVIPCSARRPASPCSWATTGGRISSCTSARTSATSSSSGATCGARSDGGGRGALPARSDRRSRRGARARPLAGAPALRRTASPFRSRRRRPTARSSTRRARPAR